MVDEKEAAVAESQVKNPVHPPASREQVTALSPSPFLTAGDELQWERVTDDGDVLQYVESGGGGVALTPLHRVYSQPDALTAGAQCDVCGAGADSARGLLLHAPW